MIGLGATELFLFLVFSLGGQTGLPLGVPPAPENPLILQFAPDECQFYSSWSATAPANSEGNVTEQWMANPEIVASFNKLKSAIKTIATSGSGRDKEFGELAFQLAERCMVNSCGFYISKVNPNLRSLTVDAGALLHLGDDAATLTEKMGDMVTALLAEEGVTVKPLDVDGVNCRTFTIEGFEENIEFTWAIVAEEYLAITVGEGEMKRLIANMKTDMPQWLVDLRDTIPVDRTSSTTWANVNSMVEVFREHADDLDSLGQYNSGIDLVGLNEVKTAGWIAGLDEHGFLCRGLVKTEGELKGALAVIGDEPLEAEDFGKIAKDRMVMTGMRISAPKIFALFRDMLDMNEWSRGDFDRGVNELNELLDLDIEEDIINNLDEKAYVYGSINFTNPTAGWVLGIGASNQMDLTDSYSKVVDFIKSSMEADEGLEFQESNVGDETIYSVKDNRGWGMPNFTWTLADGELLISMDKSSLRRHLRRESMAEDAMVNDPWFSEHALSPMHMDAEGPFMVASFDLSTLANIGMPLLSTFGDTLFPSEVDFSFSDLPSAKSITKDMKPNLSALFRTSDGFETVQRQTYPGGTPGTLMGTMGIGMVPASMQVRRAARRVEAANNMRQVMLAMHNYHDANGAFPGRFSKNDDDEQLLSWRVHLLPYLEESDLYAEFNLDEPWDSENNKALIEKMPQCYFHPAARTEEGKTVYVVPQGEGSAITDPSDSGTPKGIGLGQIADGSSNTGVIFEASAENAVVWTQPEDFKWEDIEDPVAALFGDWDGDGVNIAFGDGSVQFINKEKLREFIDKLITIDDGEAIDIWDR